MSSARYTSLVNGLPRRLPPWNQIPPPQKLMGGTILVLVILLLYMESARAPPPPHAHYPPPPGHSTEYAIRANEARYKDVLAERAAFIQSLGGASRVLPWPYGDLKQAYWTLWDFFLPLFGCPHDVQRIGRMGDGGKYVCGMDVIARKRDVVIYSMGVSDDSSYEAALLEAAPTAQVYGYDFSVDSWGPQIETVPSLKQRAHFFKYAIGDKDDHGPGSSDPEFQVYTLDTLMKLNGHTFIDILKVDIEGAEFDALRGFCKYYMSRGLPLPFGQLQVEIHAWGKNFAEFLEWFELLEAAGLRPFRSEPNLVYVSLYHHQRPELSEYAFINVGGKHEIISDMYD
ncbi:hypothetical protein DACRYDRAFT_79082 [Dacryopinax primogenitus]|uniref:Methyltransferase domain-containing protein n=1 Tax=Dacryopinax primogenitus (strain DJM 731) TaxID=1858805 RepID=M5GDE0_DACPD|nr:uncharacterized protein DACRYDRAFT_79082 [Dacryopinax primogenitus]EJU02303.1 hypothetical protein DACRYDRAFT_79082 [Dacryopinax primogenitus]